MRFGSRADWLPSRLLALREIEAFEPKLLAAVQDADPQIKVEILGSYRRGNKFSSDVDIVATHPDLKRGADEKEVKAVLTKLVEAAQKHGIIIATLADGKHVYRGLGRLAEGGATRRIDFTVTSYDGFAYRVLGFTGEYVAWLDSEILLPLLRDLKARLRKEFWLQ